MADDLEMQQRRHANQEGAGRASEHERYGYGVSYGNHPTDRLISDVRGQLGQEAAQAANIKSKLTRKHVGDAIESAISVLNRYKNAGEYGIGIFVGHVIVGNNKSRLVTVVIDDPPEIFTSFRYRCDSTFELTQLEDMLIDRNLVWFVCYR